MSKYKNIEKNSTPEPTKSKAQEPAVAPTAINTNLLFGRKNYMIMLVGLGLIFLGFALMSGGNMPSPDVWDESIIYSARRITLAPILIVAGLCIQFYALFAKKN